MLEVLVVITVSFLVVIICLMMQSYDGQWGVSKEIETYWMKWWD
jgi:hypothetical protein